MAKWDKIASRGSVDDRRSKRSMLAIGGGGISLTGLAIILVLNYLGGGEITDVLTQLGTSAETNSYADTAPYEGNDVYEVFASTVLGSNNDTWAEIFATKNKTYTEPTLVLFRTVTESSCGNASSEVGPHYCPLDNTIYLDETFFEALQSRFGAGSADVAQAYVIAHEVGHHVQNELGILEAVLEEAQSNPENAATLSIKQELQADCFAGIWAYSIRDKDIFGTNEIQEAIDAAGTVGDDRIQEKTTGRINPETWTHGSSAERIEAFTTGYSTGNMERCDYIN